MTVLASKILRIFLGVLLAISALLMILFFVNVTSLDTVIYWGYFLLIFTAVIVILFPIIFLILNPRNSIKIFISLGVNGGYCNHCLFTVDGKFTELQLEKLGTTASTVKNVGAGLIFTYILAALAVLSIVYASISRIFK